MNTFNIYEYLTVNDVSRLKRGKTIQFSTDLVPQHYIFSSAWHGFAVFPLL